MRKTTRDEDLNSLEVGKSQAKSSEGRLHRAATLEAVYEQIKDPYLEKMRIALIDALKRQDFFKMAEIKKKIESYARSPSFIQKQYRARARISKKEADSWLAKEVR